MSVPMMVVVVPPSSRRSSCSSSFCGRSSRVDGAVAVAVRVGRRGLVGGFIERFGLVIDAADCGGGIDVSTALILALLANQQRKKGNEERSENALLLFFLPNPSLSTVSSVHATL